MSSRSSEEAEEDKFENDGDIDDPDEFASGVMRLNLPVSVPKHCRNYWKEDAAELLTGSDGT